MARNVMKHKIHKCRMKLLWRGVKPVLGQSPKFAQKNIICSPSYATKITNKRNKHNVFV